MKYKILLSGLLGAVVLFSLSGCSKTMVTEKDDPQEVLKKASELMEKESRRSSKMERTYYYSDGVTEKENIKVIYDAAKGVRQETITYDMGFEFTTYNVKDGEDYYVYLQESSDEEMWIRYKEESPAEDTMYEYYAQGVDFSFNEEMGYHNVEYFNEGKDKVGEADAVRIKVQADIIYEELEEEPQEISRESVLEENGWTEEEVALVEGFSEIIDNYVKAYNVMNENEVKYEQYIWVSANTNEILKTETNTILENGSDSGEDNLAIQTFENEHWKMAVVHSDIEAGVSPEQAVKNMEAEMVLLEEDGSDMGYFPTQTKESVIEYYTYGADVDDLDRLPDEYIEMTEEEYYNGLY